jgi:hypothetical protein
VCGGLHTAFFLSQGDGDGKIESCVEPSHSKDPPTAELTAGSPTDSQEPTSPSIPARSA